MNFDNCNILCLIELYTGNDKKETTNHKSSRGRKICPITFVELNTDNTIKVGNTLFSTNGLNGLLKSQYWYRDYMTNDNNTFNFNVVWITKVNHPMTNIPFTVEEACVICASIFKQIPYFDLDEYESNDEL